MTAAGISEDDAEGKCMSVRTDGRSVDIDGDRVVVSALDALRHFEENRSHEQLPLLRAS